VTHTLQPGLHQSINPNVFLIVHADGSAIGISDGTRGDYTAAQVARVAWAYRPVLSDGDGSDGQSIDPELIKELTATTASD
jgi:hypothetical protein